MSLSVLILNAAYVALLGSTFTRRLAPLRVMLVLASIAFIIYGIVEDIPSMVLWNIGIGSMHAFRIARDFQAQRAVALTADEAQLRDEFFPGLADFDFHVLWCMGETHTCTDEVLIHEGTVPETVGLVMDGTVIVARGGTAFRGLRRGALVGEMSFVSGTPADVDVVAQGGVTVRRWDQRQLASLDQLHPSSGRAFKELLSRDLVNKARLA